MFLTFLVSSVQHLVFLIRDVDHLSLKLYSLEVVGSENQILWPSKIKNAFEDFSFILCLHFLTWRTEITIFTHLPHSVEKMNVANACTSL